MPPPVSLSPHGSRRTSRESLGSLSQRSGSRRSSRESVSDTARALQDVYHKYACFGSTEPDFRSREFAKVVKDAGLVTPAFNIKPPNRVDFVFTYACVNGPGGFIGNKSMSLEIFAAATKGIAVELGRPHEEIVQAIAAAVPLINQEPISVRVSQTLAARAVGEDEWWRRPGSPLVKRGALRTYATALSERDAEQAAHSAAAMRVVAQSIGYHAPPHSPVRSPLRSPRVAITPEWQARPSPGFTSSRVHTAMGQAS